jgi:hypothetical protein
MSPAFPIAPDQASCTIQVATGLVTMRSPAIATRVAALAARPSMCTTFSASKRCSWL